MNCLVICNAIATSAFFGAFFSTCMFFRIYILCGDPYILAEMFLHLYGQTERQDICTHFGSVYVQF